MTPTEYRKERRRLSTALNRLLRARLFETGFREGPVGQSKPLRAWVPRGRDEKPTMQTFVLRRGFVVKEFMGFVRNGLITDCGYGGLVVADFSDLPVEDLHRLTIWAEKRFAGNRTAAVH
jgi:hypothetical protein